MGEQKVSLLSSKEEMNLFVRSLLDDVQALEFMVENDWFEKGITRVGAEQEMVMVHKADYKPASIAVEALEAMKDYEWVETELAKFNLETNMTPRELKGKCFSQMEEENANNLERIQSCLDDFNAYLVLTGVLPTLRKFDMTMDNLTPKKRYYALMEAINAQLRDRNKYELKLEGIDELLIKHDSPLIEACNTSFQVHLQVHPAEFAKMYNIAQTLAAPVIAVAANSPLVFGKRLWHESRIALFQQSLDTRGSSEFMRERSPRVSFGKDWMKESILEIYKEDIARFRVLISGDVKENSLDLINNGMVPKLRSLQVHNSTVYRWNRPCYGISENGQPHLRIENRVIASGPTIIDEIANSVFWLGAMMGMADEYDDIREHISFADVSDNFVKAAKFGIDSKFTWFNDEKITASDLITKHLIPIAKKGLLKRGVDKDDVEKYLGVIHDRAESHCTGARWALRTYTNLRKEVGTDEALTVLMAAMIKNQNQNIPVHKWELPELKSLTEYRPANLKVSEFMTTDLFTAQKDDIIYLIGELMDWNDIGYMPIEDEKGNLIGLVDSSMILRSLIRDKKIESDQPTTAADIMLTDFPTISFEATLEDAILLMKSEGVSCLPVVNDDELVGIITDQDLLSILGRFVAR